MPDMPNTVESGMADKPKSEQSTVDYYADRIRAGVGALGPHAYMSTYVMSVLFIEEAVRDDRGDSGARLVMVRSILEAANRVLVEIREAGGLE